MARKSNMRRQQGRQPCRRALPSQGTSLEEFTEGESLLEISSTLERKGSPGQLGLVKRNFFRERNSPSTLRGMVYLAS